MVDPDTYSTLDEMVVTTKVCTLIAGAVIVPLLVFPFTNTLWMAFDLLSHPPDERELAEAAAAVNP